MKQINVYFDDEEYKKLKEKKGKMSWRRFILWMLEVYDGKKPNSRDPN